MMPRDWTGHAIGGACIGAMFGYVLLPSIDALEGAWPAAVLGAALGSAVAVVFAQLHAEQAAARRSTLEAAARALGAHFSAHGDAETQDFYRAFPHLQLSMENVLRAGTTELRVSAGDLLITYHAATRARTDDGWRTAKTSAVYCRAAAPVLPRFALRPAGFRLHAMRISADFAPLDFAGYTVMGEDLAATRALFGGSVLRWLEAHPGVGLEGSGAHLLAYSERLLAAPDVGGFLNATVELFSLLEPAQRSKT
jgi:hypothetical protein